ncbi:hypothetical protein FGO68_gene1388 [Halteria grandinella]|uniref:Uncharacterized protein n=1 Tax=Halteria grandinella TaxID=5974 RepID=A0A8J8NA57_HALGN|nr:hypothetical protein FGO68_gene1388 [Halteria grandinella]
MDLQRDKTPSSCSISRYQRNTFNNTASLMDPFAKLRLLHLTQNDTSPRQLTEPTPQHQSQQQRPSKKVQQLKDRLRALSQLNRGSNVSQLHEQRKAKYDNLLTSMFRVKKQTNMLPQVNNNNVKK